MTSSEHAVDLRTGRSYAPGELPRRLSRAVEIRDAARRCAQDNTWEVEVSARAISFMARTETFTILYRVPTPAILAIYDQCPGLLGNSLPWGLDVWLRGKGKVLNIEWNDRSGFSLQSFQRGEWEQDLIDSVIGSIRV